MGSPENEKYSRTRRFSMEYPTEATRLPASKMENLMLYIPMSPEELKVLVQSRDILAKYKLHAEDRMLVALLKRVALRVL
jgi:hypothetical protein